MKKYLLLLLLILPIYVCAASTVTINAPATVEVGKTINFKVNANNVASWNIKIKGSGSISCGENHADATENARNTNKTFTISCKANSVGSAILTVTGDVTDENGNTTDNISVSKSVTVTEVQVDTRSSNKNITSLEVAGYQPIKVDNTKYTLEVPSSVSVINVDVLLEDSKASVKGTGKHNLSIGENDITLIVTAENQSTSTIHLIVTRKEGYSIEDLEDIINTEENTTITIDGNTNINGEMLNKLINSQKTITLDVEDENSNVIYSWTIDGSKANVVPFNTEVFFTSNNANEIRQLTNYADGKFVNFAHEGPLPTGTIIKIYVADKFNDNDSVKIYTYKDNKMELVKDNVIVSNGYVELDLDHCSEYFVTMSTIDATPTNGTIYFIIAIIEFLLLLVVITISIIKLRMLH